MSRILCIDTALETAHVGIAEHGRLIVIRSNTSQMDHAAWIHTAIREIVSECQMTMKALDAVAVTSGPGSYTGLRVGMATAKGLCYALNKPLLAENTLKLTAIAARGNLKEPHSDRQLVFRPMIDARRMEVFTALYNLEIEEVQPPAAMILDDLSLTDELLKYTVVFSGNGAEKWKKICTHKAAVFLAGGYELAQLADVAEKKLQVGQFSDLAYLEPDYFKSFYTGT